MKNVFANETIVILGSGDLSQGLITCLTRRGYRVIVASRNPDKHRARIEGIGGEIDNYANALLQGNIVIVAVPFEAFGTLPVDLLEGKIVVDVSNRPLDQSRGGPSLAYQLQKLLPGSKVVKAFNTLSAYGLQNNLFQGSKEVPICSDDDEAKISVMTLVRNLGFIPVDRGNLSSASEIEEITLAFFPHWKLASKIALAVFGLSFVIIFFRSQLCPNFENTKKGWDWKTFEKFPLVTVHGSFACTAITLLSLCYLPGVIAGYIQLYRGTKYSEFPKWLDNWLRSRKQIGLLTQVFASMHTLMAILDVIRRGIELWLDYTYLSFGCFAIGLMTILAITSLPSVSESLTWREFSFVQRYLGWWALACAVLHLIFKKWSKLISNSQRCIVIPDPGQIFILLPIITILLKLVLITPCIDSRIQKIRRGIERESDNMPPVLKLYGQSESHELSENGTSLGVNICDDNQKENSDSTIQNFAIESPVTASHLETIVLLGSGELARGLLICLVRRGYKVVVGSRNPDKNRLRVERIGGEIADYRNALNEGKIVIIAIPLEGFETLPSELLKGKVVVDVSNRSMNLGRDGPSLAYQLQKLLPDSKVVKAFNTLSAYGLQNNLFQGSKEIPVCSDYDDAKAMVTAMVRNLGFTPVDRGNLSSATEIEDIPLAFFTEWRLAGKLSLIILTFVFFIQFFRSQLCPNFQRADGKDWDWSTFARLPLVTVHASAGGTSISLLASCYFPGVIAGYLQLYRGTKYSEFPKWLDIWLRSRKQIGILAYAFGSMHTLMAIFDVIRRGMEEWRDFSYTAFGCFAIGLMTILAITSLPSVSDSLTWREFSCVQRYLGWWALTFAVIHLIFKKWNKLVTNVQKCVILPDVGQITIILPLVTMLLKLILILPCIDKRIQKIRRGYERKSVFLSPA